MAPNGYIKSLVLWLNFNQPKSTLLSMVLLMDGYPQTPSRPDNKQ